MADPGRQVIFDSTREGNETERSAKAPIEVEVTNNSLEALLRPRLKTEGNKRL